MKSLIVSAALFVATLVHAETPLEILSSLSVEAGVTASPARGEALFRGKFVGGKSAESCTACHGEEPKASGQHIKTHKVIDPIAPVARRERFSDPARVEKWFRRNCPEVLGRACTPGEKADFTAYMISVK